MIRTWLVVMALFWYLSTKMDSLIQEGKCPPLTLLPVIAQVNDKVHKATGSKKQKQRPYKWYIQRIMPLAFTSVNFPNSCLQKVLIDIVVMNAAKVSRNSFVNSLCLHKWKWVSKFPGYLWNNKIVFSMKIIWPKISLPKKFQIYGSCEKERSA